MIPILNLTDLDLTGSYTYADYLLWQFRERVEIILGKVFPMAAPSSRHQHAVAKVTGALSNYLSGSGCGLYPAPYDVILPGENGLENTVVQPDVCVICDQSKIHDRGCFGAPDLVVEILSPSSFKRDLDDKLRLYEHHQVQEYWTIDLSRKLVLVHCLGPNGKFLPPLLSVDDEVLRSQLFPGIALDLHTTFNSVVQEPEAAYGEYPPTIISGQ
ncbi:MAG: Uma2 family endonuclease [Bacteroidota bacterium]